MVIAGLFLRRRVNGGDYAGPGIYPGSTDQVKEGLKALNAEAPIDEIMSLDEQRRALLGRVELLRAERNAGSKDVGRLMREKQVAQAEALKKRMSEIGEEISGLDGTLEEVEKKLQDNLLMVPNMPLPSVPVGPDESHNLVVRMVGSQRKFEFEPLPHWDIGEGLGIIDFERGVKLSGSRFYVLKGAAPGCSGP